MKLRNNKGVTIYILCATIAVLIIITGIMVTYSQDYVALNKVNDLFNDIEAINVAVSDYYLKNDTLPIFENAYVNSRDELSNLFTKERAKTIMINPDDGGEYYVINLSKLDNLTLKYGKSYKNWKGDSSSNDYKDLYIINKVTHQVYYAQGVSFNGDVYFTNESFVAEK